MTQCKHCDVELTPSKKGKKSFCGSKCRSRYWYSQNKEVTIERAKAWREENPEKMAECRLEWRKNNPTYHSEYTMSWRGDGESARIAIEAVREAKELTPEERIILAEDILDMKLGMSIPNEVESFLVETLE